MITEKNGIRNIIEILKSKNIQNFTKYFPTVGVDMRDDCAVIQINEHDDLIIGSDFIRGTEFHLFEKGIMSYYDIGYYLICANLSDIAAMGATPVGVTTIIRYNESIDEKRFNQIINGISDACKEYQTCILGGDIGSYCVPVLSATAIGIVKHNCALLRSGGSHGDRLFLTGKVGTAAAASAYFTRHLSDVINLEESQISYLKESWTKVKPAIEQGRILSENRLSTCAIDTSDGLKASLRQLSEGSQLDAIVYREKIPIDPLSEKIAMELNIDPIAFAMSDSVDFRLLFSCNKNNVKLVNQLFRNSDFELYEIGEFAKTDKAHGSYIIDAGEKKVLPGIEWDQTNENTIDRLIREKGY